MKYNGAGIYGIYNVIDNKIYIGKSKNIAMRFFSHVENFENGIGGNEMYAQPIENFVFIVLHKMSLEEYAKFGDLLETLLIASALRERIPVYNKNKLRKDATGEALSAFGVYDSIARAVRNAIGASPSVVGLMSEKTRRNRLKIAREKEKEA